MARIAWVLTDPETSDTYSFSINPKEGGSPARAKTTNTHVPIASDGDPLPYEGADEPLTADVSGTILYEEQYHAMVEWFSKRYPLLLEDDLGREYRIYITGFQPDRVWSWQYPWRHNYSMRYLVLEEL